MEREIQLKERQEGRGRDVEQGKEWNQRKELRGKFFFFCENKDKAFLMKALECF